MVRRALLAIAGLLLLVRCGTFTSEEIPSQDAGPADGSALPDGGPSSGPDSAASDAAAKRTQIRCGADVTCNVAAGERCCLYRQVGTTRRRAECAPAGACPAPDASEGLEVESVCDDSTACSAGEVCCHTAKSCLPSVRALDSVACTAASNCRSCDAGGTGKIACDPGLAAPCKRGACVSDPDAVIAGGYCD